MDSDTDLAVLSFVPELPESPVRALSPAFAQCNKWLHVAPHSPVLPQTARTLPPDPSRDLMEKRRFRGAPPSLLEASFPMAIGNAGDCEVCTNQSRQRGKKIPKVVCCAGYNAAVNTKLLNSRQTCFQQGLLLA